MNLRRLLVVPVSIVLAAALSSCAGHKKKPDPPEEGPKLSDQNSDTSFQAFLNRLRRAVSLRDKSVLAGMMTTEFGYSFNDSGGEPSVVFDYWDKNNLWQEVSLVIGERFAPYRAYMVSPATEVASPNYNGYIAGLQIVNGSWKFAYFISARDARQAAAASAASSETTR